ncbi:MAG: helix-turn-helix domain-containing protein [Oscillospiraceae bacterium]|nr:helix-turn-helix domain-containing protein [Oscillospiraceae bacterium]
MDNDEIGARVEKLRTEQGITQEAFAEMVGYGPYQVKSLERGARGMSLPKAVAVADALGVSLDYLVLGESSDPIGSKEVMDALDEVRALHQQRESLIRKRAELDAQIEQMGKNEDYLLTGLAFKLHSS